MTFTPASPESVFSFLLIVGSVLFCILAGVYFSSVRMGDAGAARTRTMVVGLGLFAWLALVCVVVRSGWVQEQPMPRLMMFFGFVNLCVLVFALGPVGRWLSFGLPVWLLLGFQGFRLPLELVLHTWGQQGVIPMSMTWEGQNWDIISGAVALVTGALSIRWRWRWTAWIGQIVGFVLLLNVARVAILSSPLPFAWNVDPPLQLGFHLPYALILPVCVGGALAGHLILFRALLRRKSKSV